MIICTIQLFKLFNRVSRQDEIPLQWEAWEVLKEPGPSWLMRWNTDSGKSFLLGLRLNQGGRVLRSFGNISIGALLPFQVT